MAFSVRCDFNRIQSHTEAFRAWQGGIIFPKDRKLNNPWLPRGLVNVRKRHMTIERDHEGGDIILRLYGSAIVTWHPDNSFTIAAYNTRSTMVFAGRCTPTGVWVCSSRGYFTVMYDGRFYKISNRSTFREHADGWKPDQIDPWSVPFVNREHAEFAFKETNYKDFRLWFKTYVQMSQPSLDRRYLDNAATISMLRDRKWRELVAYFGPGAWTRPVQTLHAIRHAIYVTYDCIEHRQVPFLERG